MVTPLLPVLASTAALAGQILPPEALYLVLVAVLLWPVVGDERILLAIGITLSVGSLQAVSYAITGDDPRMFLLAVSRLLIPAILLATGAMIATRRARV